MPCMHIKKVAEFVRAPIAQLKSDNMTVSNLTNTVGLTRWLKKDQT